MINITNSGVSYIKIINLVLDNSEFNNTLKMKNVNSISKNQYSIKHVSVLRWMIMSFSDQIRTEFGYTVFN